MSSKTETKEAQEEEKINKMTETAIMANAAAERLETANKRHDEIQAQKAKEKEEKLIDGVANAGSQTITNEEMEIASAKKILEGTGFEDMFDSPKTKI
jgi:hypothetical protein